MWQSLPPSGNTDCSRICFQNTYDYCNIKLIRKNNCCYQSTCVNPVYCCYCVSCPIYFPLIASLEKLRGLAQNNYDKSAAYRIWCLFHTKNVMTFYLSILQCKLKTLQKDKQRLHFKKTAVAGNVYVFSYSFRNNKHCLLTFRLSVVAWQQHTQLGWGKHLWRRARGSKRDSFWK